jgi:fructokinase
VGAGAERPSLPLLPTMIVVAGEALVDLIPTASGDLSINLGGGPFNTARWLGRLGADVAFLGTIAADPLGQRLRDDLVATGAALDLVVATQLPTTLALAQLDAAGSATYSFYTDATSVSDLTSEQAQAQLPDSFDALYLGGLGLMLEPIASALTSVVALAKGRGAMVMVDPNIRPSLIDDRDAYLTRFKGILELADVLKLSVEDAAWLGPNHDHGPGTVLLTAGADGATVFTSAGATHVPAVSVDVVDPIGAGDAFSAGFLQRWLDDRDDVAGAARFAAQVASLACAQRGATPPVAAAAILRPLES